MYEDGDTRKFTLRGDKDKEMKVLLTAVYEAIKEKGFTRPVDQIVGYLLTEDPVYITNYKNARNIIRHIDRDELLQALVKSYLNIQ